MIKWIKERLKEPSTKKGLALVGAGAAVAIGHPELITAAVTEHGIEWGGVIGTTLPIVLGVWETVRKEFA